ncbi:Mth938-like domain-containing protein [Hydrogenophaga sp.]|uniref:Mth938-like domain-containing protein n=1 Tax=Hydrogenophaga sp. TaxID=1904254 RepID=UPI003F6F1DF8
MKLHADQPDSQSITAYGPGWIAVNGQRQENSLVLSATHPLQAWNCNRFEELTADHFERLADFGGEAPELVIFGSGARLRFVRPALLQGLMARRIGVETMDTAAACRTFNILAGEGRRVVAAFLIEA